MAIFGKDGKERTHDAIPLGTKTDGVAPREVAMGERGIGGVDAFLGKGTKITGKVTLEGTARIEGQIDGEISSHDTLTIGEGATVKAKISGTTIVVDGHITGDITARQRLELRPSGHVQGNISTPSLVVHEGAILDGQCSMGGAQARAIGDTPEAKATASLDQAREKSLAVVSTFSR